MGKGIPNPPASPKSQALANIHRFLFVPLYGLGGAGHPGQDGKPSRIGGDVQVEIEETVYQHAAASQGCAQSDPAAVDSELGIRRWRFFLSFLTADR